MTSNQFITAIYVGLQKINRESNKKAISCPDDRVLPGVALLSSVLIDFINLKFGGSFESGEENALTWFVEQ